MGKLPEMKSRNIGHSADDYLSLTFFFIFGGILQYHLKMSSKHMWAGHGFIFMFNYPLNMALNFTAVGQHKIISDLKYDVIDRKPLKPNATVKNMCHRLSKCCCG